MTYTPPQERPGIYNAFAVLTLVDGILNLIWGLMAGGFLLCTTIICAPLGIYPIVLGIMEIVQFSSLNSTPPVRRDVPIWLCVMQIINMVFGNPISLVAGILGLVASNDPNVQRYLRPMAPHPVAQRPPPPITDESASASK